MAWEPIFPSFEQILGQTIYKMIWPDWKTGRKEEVEDVCRDEDKTMVLVAELQGTVVGFVAYELGKGQI